MTVVDQMRMDPIRSYIWMLGAVWGRLECVSACWQCHWDWTLRFPKPVSGPLLSPSAAYRSEWKASIYPAPVLWLPASNPNNNGLMLKLWVRSARLKYRLILSWLDYYALARLGVGLGMGAGGVNTAYQRMILSSTEYNGKEQPGLCWRTAYVLGGGRG